MVRTVRGQKFAPGGYEIAGLTIFNIPGHHVMLGMSNNRQLVLFHEYRRPRPMEASAQRRRPMAMETSAQAIMT